MNGFQAPKMSPPDHLRLECACVLPRLRLIPEFQLWLDFSLLCNSQHGGSPFRHLWNCFALGAPLCTLLDLLGTPSDIILDIDIQDIHPDIEFVDREKFIASFLRRVQLLELQGRLSYGEVFRSDDLFNGTYAGFAKVLRTVRRVLNALEESYPGLFIVPKGSHSTRRQLIQELLDSEQTHIGRLKKMTHSAAILSEGINTADRTHLECFAINSERLLQFHEHVLRSLEKLVASTESHEEWDTVYALNDTLYTTAMCTCKSHCANYLTTSKCIEEVVEPAFAPHACTLLDLIATPISRISDYQHSLQSILDITLPTPRSSYDSLCLSLFKIGDVVKNIEEVGLQVRTMWSGNILKTRAHVWNGIDPEQLGNLLLDDVVVVDMTGQPCCLFMFESMFLCCEERIHGGYEGDRTTELRYPILPWELGLALKRKTPLSVLHAIPTTSLKAVRCADFDSFEIDWVDKDILHTLVFCSCSQAQIDQWYSVLCPFAPSTSTSPVLQKRHFAPIGDEGVILSEDEDAGGRRRGHARPWSLIARKGPRSESSSMLHQEFNDYEFPLSPNLLPSLFNTVAADNPSWSPLSINTGFLHGLTEAEVAKFAAEMLPTPPPESITSSVSSEYLPVLDFTGQITREGRYPFAHGGFADVWKGLWNDGSEERKVAVKVLRSRIDDPDLESKMKQRLRRELRVWQRLQHEHLLPLLATASDFGHYTSMVCPWLEQGSVSKYMERCGDILTVYDRLQLLCGVAAGLSYLHSHSVIHGDLTGSNILISDEGKAILCDFGLSCIVAEFQGTSYLTSTIGGAVRWAASELYHVHEDDFAPTISTQSDIYSFGSVMLEILTGRIPYHYLRTDAQVVIELHKGVKPRRPTESFVTDAQWNFIQLCWADDPDDRPQIGEVDKCLQSQCRMILERRRHTG